jgi:hypothetical protein
MIDTKNEWETCKTQVFWGEIAPCDHVVQIYENNDVFLNSLEGFVTGGFHAENGVIVIGTSNHLEALNYRIIQNGFDPRKLEKHGQYIPLEASETLNKFMRNGWPDEQLFRQTVTDVVLRAKQNGRKVRAFGEMVALLWAEGMNGATVQLENLWNQFCQAETFSLFCAYPKSGFTQDPSESIKNICCTHSRVIGGWDTSKTEIFYRSAAEEQR